MTPLQLTGKYRIVVEGDIDALRIGYDLSNIGYLFQRLLTGEPAAMENLANWGITVKLEDDEFVTIPRLEE